jgi:hypothetical protein
MTSQLSHGGYGQDCPEGIHQHKYAGGGHAGCGGYIEALEIECVERGVIFLLHEHVHDQAAGLPPQRWRWKEYKDCGELLDAFEKLWGSHDRDGFSPWFNKPYWKIVNYNNVPQFEL